MQLPYLRRAAPDVLATARAQRWDPAEALRVLLAEEVVHPGTTTNRSCPDRNAVAGHPTLTGEPGGVQHLADRNSG
jgi:hypothetical protein